MLEIAQGLWFISAGLAILLGLIGLTFDKAPDWTANYVIGWVWLHVIIIPLGVIAFGVAIILGTW